MRDDYEYSTRWFPYEVFKETNKKGKKGSFIVPFNRGEGFDTLEEAKRKYEVSYKSTAHHKVIYLKYTFYKIPNSLHWRLVKDKK